MRDIESESDDHSFSESDATDDGNTRKRVLAGVVGTAVVGVVLLSIGLWRLANENQESAAGIDGEYGHFDSHNHIGGAVGWRGYTLAYLIASKDVEFNELLERAPLYCPYVPTDFGRDATDSVKDLCFYEWMRTVYLRTNGCREDNSCDPANLELVRYVAKHTGKVIHDKLSGRTYLGIAIKRQQWNSHTEFPLLKCIEEFMERNNMTDLSNDEALMLDKMIDSTLSASPLVDFDSAYVGRAVLLKSFMVDLSASGTDHSNVDCPEAPYRCKQGQMLVNVHLYSLHELLMLGVAHVQWSHPHFKLPLHDCDSLPGLVDGKPPPHFMVHACREFEPLYWLIFIRRIPAIQNMTFYFNPMFVTKEFADTGTTKHHSEVYNIVSGQADSLGESFPSSSDGGVGILGDPIVGLTDNLLDEPHMNGVDFASPEYSEYDLINESGQWTEGGLFLQRTLDAVFAQAKKRNSTMFFHVHVGEGFPVWNYAANGFVRDAWEDPCSFDEISKWTCPWARAPRFDMKESAYEGLCSTSSADYSAQPRLHLNRDTNGRPLHYASGLANMKRMLDGIEKYRAELQALQELEVFDASVVVVFGHSTHADEEVAERMVRNKIWADINLSSNLATSAIAEVTPSLFKDTGMTTPVRFLESLTSTPNPALQEFIKAAFAPHAFTKLYQAGVCLTLSTDGSGVEHSHFDQEYRIAEILAGREAARQLKAMEVRIMRFLQGETRSLYPCRVP
eukprot:TRINITY_DN4011_c1_g8_i1.p1 TRINITY_DN4011_c1_g8~~TRINITY_DN4011_c1_g8_i1.p1  ORF type:complete len:733 (-),score=70.49 TRINITY_DN4011_c1_g8_i1:90-2288(-)